MNQESNIRKTRERTGADRADKADTERTRMALL